MTPEDRRATKVWVVVDRNNQHRILAIFDTKELADEFCEEVDGVPFVRTVFSKQPPNKGYNS
jgi:hypothetical protein